MLLEEEVEAPIEKFTAARSKGSWRLGSKSMAQRVKLSLSKNTRSSEPHGYENKKKTKQKKTACSLPNSDSREGENL